MQRTDDSCEIDSGNAPTRYEIGTVSFVTARTVIVALVAALGTALLIGIPTDVVPNAWFGREIGVRAFDVVTLIALSIVTGALVATYTVAGDSGVGAPRAGLGSGILGWFAVGCPVCNKLVVALLGASGATSTFAPLQPLLGAAAVLLASAALVVRVRAIRRGTCPLPAELQASSSTP
jgi:hypothetical protein